ncbi:hypothetical protein D3C71_1271560 [compost metagenome]
MGIGQQHIEIVVGQNQQLAAGIAGAGRVGVVIQCDVVDIAVAFLIIHGDTAGYLVVDDRTAAGHCRSALVVVPGVGLRGKTRFEGWVFGLDDNGTGQGVTALGGGLRAKEDFDLLDVPQRHRAEGQCAVRLHGAVDEHRNRTVERGRSLVIETGHRYTTNAPVFVTGLVVHARRTGEYVDQVMVGLFPQLFVGDDHYARLGLFQGAVDFFTRHRDRGDFHCVRLLGRPCAVHQASRRPHSQRNCIFFEIHAPLPCDRYFVFFLHPESCFPTAGGSLIESNAETNTIDNSSHLYLSNRHVSNRIHLNSICAASGNAVFMDFRCSTAGCGASRKETHAGEGSAGVGPDSGTHHCGA